MLFGILIYDGAEPIDLATFGVLSMAKRIQRDIEVCTVAPRTGVTVLASGLRIVADYDFANAPVLDVLVVTGGTGWLAQSNAAETLDFIRGSAHRTHIVSVCTGGMIVAASGILDGKAATTKREVVAPESSPLAMMQEKFPAIDVRAASFVDAGGIITGGGVSLCIDTMLHVLAKCYGREMAEETARIIEYQRAWAANSKLFPPLQIDVTSW